MKLCANCGREMSDRDIFCSGCGTKLDKTVKELDEVSVYPSSLPHRIWRVIYPPVIYVGMSFVAVFIATFVYAMYLSVQDAANGIISDFDALFTDTMDFVFNQALWLTFASCAVCCIIFIPMWRATIKRYVRVSGNKLTAANVALTVFISVSAYFLVGSLITFLDLTRFFPSYEGLSDVLISGGFIVQFLTVGLAAPIVEELCFRGIVFNRLLFWMPVWAALIIQGALFGIAHLNPLQGMYAFALGILFGWIYLRFRTIWLPVIGHIVFNMTQVVLTAIANFAGVTEDVAESVEVAPTDILVILIPSAFIFALCLWLMLKLPKAVSRGAGSVNDKSGEMGYPS